MLERMNRLGRNVELVVRKPSRSRVCSEYYVTTFRPNRACSAVVAGYQEKRGRSQASRAFLLTGSAKLMALPTVADSGLLTTLLELTSDAVQQDRTRFGSVLETFVFGELFKQMTPADGDYRLMYCRDADKVEVDVVIENAAGQLVCVEVKASATVKESDLRGLKKLASLAGDQFKMGLLLYDGDETLPLGDKIWAAPLATLWGR